MISRATTVKTIERATMPIRSLFSGKQILQRFMKPTTVIVRVARVLNSLYSSCPHLLRTRTAPTPTRRTAAYGMLILRTFLRNPPLIWSLFGCNDKKNDGMPMTNASSKKTCAGANG